jgi:hypothetical protein
MPIKNKDGSTYKLRSPHDLVKNQEFWDMSSIKFWNMDWNSVVISYDKENKNKNTEEDLVEENNDILIEENEKEYVDEHEMISSTEDEKNTEDEINLDLKNIIEIHCLPCIIKKTKDEFYGEEVVRKYYGERMKIEGIIIEISDIKIEFWSKDEIAINSIVYFSKYKDGPNFPGFRWWKIEIKEEKPIGFSYVCTFTDVQPNFKD